MNIYIKLITIINLLLSLNFFELVNFNYEISDLIIVNCILMPFIFLRSFLKFIKNNKFLIFFFLYLYLTNVFSSLINYNQPFIETILSGRFLFTYLLLSFTLYLYIREIKTINFLPIYIILPILLVNLYAYMYNDLSFVREGVYIGSRFNNIRFLLCGGLLIYIVIYSFNRLKLKIFFLITFIFSLFILMFISQTRGIIFPILLTILIGLNLNGFINKNKIIFINIVIVLFVIFFYIFDLFMNTENLISSIMYEFNSNKINNILVRFDAFYYYNTLFNRNIITILFGSGLPTEFTFSIHDNYSLSDIGFFRFIFNHGIISTVLFIYLLIKPIKGLVFFKKNNNILRNDYKLFLIIQILTFFSITFFYNISSIIIFFMIYFSNIQLNSTSHEN